MPVGPVVMGLETPWGYPVGDLISAHPLVPWWAEYVAAISLVWWLISEAREVLHAACEGTSSGLHD